MLTGNDIKLEKGELVPHPFPILDTTNMMTGNYQRVVLIIYVSRYNLLKLILLLV